MKLLIEESDDHATCMDIIRTKYGADCLVVHSFRLEDTYRVLIALESAEENAHLRSLEPLKNVVTQRSGVLLSETQIASESETKAKVVNIFKKYNADMLKAGRPYRYG